MKERWERLTVFCRDCAWPVFFAVIVSVVVFLVVIRWFDEQRTGRFQDRLINIEVKQRVTEGERNADMAATKVLVLALVPDTLPSDKVKVIEINVKKAAGTHGLSPAFVQLLRELRARAKAERREAAHLRLGTDAAQSIERQ